MLPKNPKNDLQEINVDSCWNASDQTPDRQPSDTAKPNINKNNKLNN